MRNSVVKRLSEIMEGGVIQNIPNIAPPNISCLTSPLNMNSLLTILIPFCFIIPSSLLFFLTKLMFCCSLRIILLVEENDEV